MRIASRWVAGHALIYACAILDNLPGWWGGRPRWGQYGCRLGLATKGFSLLSANERKN